MKRDEVEPHKDAKSGQYPAMLTELSWSINGLLYGIKNTIKNEKKAHVTHEFDRFLPRG